MAYLDMVASDDEDQPLFETKEYEYKGKKFLIVQDDPNGLWSVQHATTHKRVAAADGLYTSPAQARKAIHQLPLSVFTASMKKAILIPKVKNDKERGSDA